MHHIQKNTFTEKVLYLIEVYTRKYMPRYCSQFPILADGFFFRFTSSENLFSDAFVQIRAKSNYPFFL